MVKKAKEIKTARDKQSKKVGIWVPSGDKPPVDRKHARDAVKKALKKGNVVLVIGGKFLRVPLTQKLSLKSPSELKSEFKRYEKYAAARTVAEAFKLGALVGDMGFSLKSGLLKFLPSLKGTAVETPLPMSEWPAGIREGDGHAPWWLPSNWTHGVKTTCRTYLPVYIAPNGRTCYHQEVVEAIVGEELGRNVDCMVDWAKKQMSEVKDWHGEAVAFDADSKLFSCLSKQERAHLPPASELHVGVISARRATELSGIRGIVNVQSRLLAAGIKPRWYVDADSLEDYRKLGLDAVVGGKLTPSRNKALQDAAKLNKVCVQCSDDIYGWEFYKSDLDAKDLRSKGAVNMLKHANAAILRSRLVVSPAAAARFLLAKMRADPGRPRIGGVLPTENGAMALLAQMTTMDGFILGDFFVHDKSPCRFDNQITLKEDYDFTCSHLKRHGCVLRCNRLVLKVVHETNAGGAVAVRDSSGDKERQNIKILMRKWPGVFKLHSTRGDTQVKMKWKHRK
ncbi:unnamed protein product [Polarella glacialis]|uniref:Uncharacterized protein n=1 Tax=Polarella glacialis TaxID=89957 RepID=A0A813EGP5_POLGL|nr:unnamed protein product [Polarella glacialis]|mmetsp:Transcript_15804/g.28069  ORF Transcript_15804/g.28069 Transcript_15804/m.28069 type:complete len:509 (+) Transcript_15804:72-1598(+)|eukprot:CAMPEP_0115072074 /NCGR_PEP_ID=MMETSP0227-20121206/14024_1 /TAXON_ID=89957 /ORGANISM="Polarella glacialis, Strain CCMP 1383" /LENGTH=508 /DNA_ID=CAMNT_0002458773 /DNA_START=72 /DNA_END=1598 /DNA_ORIENTATION=+